MDDRQLNPTTAPRSAGWKSWTPRVILWTLASLAGLWLGTGVRTAAAGGQAARPAATSQAAIADIFRFDILLAGREAPAARIHPKALPAAKCNLPAAVLAAMQQRPEPVPSVMPQTLSGPHARFAFTPPAKPARSWNMKWDSNAAQLQQAQRDLRASVAKIPGLTPADRKSIQTEVDNACAQVEERGMEQAIHAAEPPALPTGLPEARLDRRRQLMQ